MAGYVVVDASLVVKWLLTEDFTEQADALAQHWLRENVQMAAPSHMRVEATNALFKRLVRGEHSLADVQVGIESLLALDLQIHNVSNLHARATELAALLRQGAVYDAHYLALAESLGCELWTADQRFQGVASSAGHSVHWVGDFVTPGAL